MNEWVQIVDVLIILLFVALYCMAIFKLYNDGTKNTRVSMSKSSVVFRHQDIAHGYYKALLELEKKNEQKSVKEWT